jgi:hypothetical protein
MDLFIILAVFHLSVLWNTTQSIKKTNKLFILNTKPNIFSAFLWVIWEMGWCFFWCLHWTPPFLVDHVFHIFVEKPVLDFILHNSRCQVLCGSCKDLPRILLQYWYFFGHSGSLIASSSYQVFIAEYCDVKMLYFSFTDERTQLNSLQIICNFL